MPDLAQLSRLISRRRPNSISFHSLSMEVFRRRKRETSRQWLDRIVRSRFTKRAYEKRFQTPASLLSAYRDVAKWITRRRPQDPLLHQLAQLDDTRLGHAAQLVWYLWRGYSDGEFFVKTAEFARLRKNHLALAGQLLRDTRQMLRRYNTTSQYRAARGLRDHRPKLLRQNIHQLQAIRRVVLALNPHTEARRHFVERQWNREFQRSTLLPTRTTWAFSIRQAQIERLDPRKLEYPLRFLVHQDADVLTRLKTAWSAGTTREALLQSLSPTVLNEDALVRLEMQVRESVIAREAWRVAAVKELREAALAGHLLSAGFIAVTQCEGAVWSYAKHLSENRVFVVKPIRRASGKVAYVPFEWDMATGDYAKKARNGRPLAKRDRRDKYVELRSGRELIETTIFQNILPA